MIIPPAPQPSWREATAYPNRSQNERPSSQRSVPASTHLAPLDAAFLSRTLRTTIWLGALFTLCAYAFTQSYIATWSFALGATFGALMLKSTEIFVRRLIRPKDAPPYSGWDALIPLWALLPVKWSLVIGTLALLFYFKMINPVAFAIGFPTVQLVIVAKTIGRVMAQRTRSIHDVYVSKGRSDVHDA